MVLRIKESNNRRTSYIKETFDYDLTNLLIELLTKTEPIKTDGEYLGDETISSKDMYKYDTDPTMVEVKSDMYDFVSEIADEIKKLPGVKKVDVVSSKSVGISTYLTVYFEKPSDNSKLTQSYLSAYKGEYELKFRISNHDVQKATDADVLIDVLGKKFNEFKDEVIKLVKTRIGQLDNYYRDFKKSKKVSSSQKARNKERTQRKAAYAAVQKKKQQRTRRESLDITDYRLDDEDELLDSDIIDMDIDVIDSDIADVDNYSDIDSVDIDSNIDVDEFDTDIDEFDTDEFDTDEFDIEPDDIEYDLELDIDDLDDLDDLIDYADDLDTDTEDEVSITYDNGSIYDTMGDTTDMYVTDEFDIPEWSEVLDDMITKETEDYLQAIGTDTSEVLASVVAVMDLDDCVIGTVADCLNDNIIDYTCCDDFDDCQLVYDIEERLYR